MPATENVRGPGPHGHRLVLTGSVFLQQHDEFVVPDALGDGSLNDGIGRIQPRRLDGGQVFDLIGAVRVIHDFDIGPRLDRFGERIRHGLIVKRQSCSSAISCLTIAGTARPSKTISWRGGEKALRVLIGMFGRNNSQD